MSDSGKLTALESIRGLAMLGVLGIHTGSYVLGTPTPNPHAIALFEILSRFSVPIFFFVSAFGLFLPKAGGRPFSYLTHLLRRGQSVLVPYLAWSLLYMLHYTQVYDDAHIWTAPTVYDMLFFGLSSYHLYFLLILLAFYLLMPLWRLCVPFLCRHWQWALPLAFFVQIGFDYYSSYLLHASYSEDWLDRLLFFRVNYWPFHYAFIFLLGGVAAARLPEFRALLSQHRPLLRSSYAASILLLLGHYYYLLHLGYSIVDAVNTAHQLSPFGIFYTTTSCLFLFDAFSGSGRVSRWFAALGSDSYCVYLFHPLAMFYLWKYWEVYDLPTSDRFGPLFYCAALLCSLFAAKTIEKTGRFLPVIGFLLLGKKLRGMRP